MCDCAARLPLFELSCVDDSGTERLFYYDHERDEVDSDIIYFRVHPRNPPRECLDRWFSLELKRMDSASYWLKDIAANQYRGKCIPETLLKEATRLIQADVVSSVKDNPADPAERRTDQADSMWNRLCRKGLARFEQSTGRYRFPHQVQGS